MENEKQIENRDHETALVDGLMRDRIQEQKRIKRSRTRRLRDQAMRDIGMTKVRGNLGGTYWE
jgi:hypothetical protein